MSPGRLRAAIFLVSGAGIAYELALVRIFSIAQWHHLAHMAISMAMLGFGVAGTVLALAGGRLAGRERGVLTACTALVPLALAACYEASQRIPFETYQLLVRPAQAGWLLALYALLSLPFLLISACIALGLLLDRRVGLAYAASLGGSALGAGGAVLALFAVPPSALPYLAAGVAAPAFFLAAGGWRERGAGALVLSLLAAVVAAGRTAPIRLSEYKPLAYALRLPDARVVARAGSPVSEVTAVASDFLRETPGQVSGYRMEGRPLPEQIGLFFDGGAPSPVHRFDGSLAPFGFLDHVTSALPYHVLRRPRVLVVGAGGGTEVLSALYHGSADVTALEVERAVPQLLAGPLEDFSGDLYARPEVRLAVAEGRGWLEAHAEERFDLIQISLLDAYAASAAGVHAAGESYLYTVEAVELYLRRLTPRGVLAITRWLGSPPRDAVKLLATLVRACQRAGCADPARHVAAIRSWNTATLLLSRARLSGEQVAAVRRFATERSFDRDWHPGMRTEEANRTIILPDPAVHRAAVAFFSGRGERFLGAYPFHVRPATDDRPYFFRFVELRTLPELVRRLGPNWSSFVEWGYVLLVATVAQAGAAALLLVLLPLWAGGGGVSETRTPAVLVFGGLGLGYIALEIVFLQRFLLFLLHPAYAVAIVLVGFLAFSGAGSAFAARPGPPRRRLLAAVAAIVLLGGVYAAGLPPLLRALGGWGWGGRVAAALALLAPLAFCMGIPFPTALQKAADERPALVPWAWAVNGAASVLGASLAALLAVHLGLRAVGGLAVLFYVVAAAGYLRLERRLAATGMEDRGGGDVAAAPSQ